MCRRPTNLYKDVDTGRLHVLYTQLAAPIFSAVQHAKAAFGWVVPTPRYQVLLWLSCTTNNTTTAHVVLKSQVKEYFAAMQNDNCLQPAFVHNEHERPTLTKQRDRAGWIFSINDLMLNCVSAMLTSRSHFLTLGETHSCHISTAPNPCIWRIRCSVQGIGMFWLPGESRNWRQKSTYL